MFTPHIASRILHAGTFLTLLLLSCRAANAPKDSSHDSAGTAPSTQAQITIDNFSFQPATLTIRAGTTVTWINHDDMPQTATSAGKPPLFNSGALDTDGKFSFVFTTSGTYDYFCAIHTHMTGKIIVK